MVSRNISCKWLSDFNRKIVMVEFISSHQNFYECYTDHSLCELQ